VLTLLYKGFLLGYGGYIAFKVSVGPAVAPCHTATDVASMILTARAPALQARRADRRYHDSRRIMLSLFMILLTSSVVVPASVGSDSTEANIEFLAAAGAPHPSRS
jgi:hypothetical protein